MSAKISYDMLRRLTECKKVKFVRFRRYDAMFGLKARTWRVMFGDNLLMLLWSDEIDITDKSTAYMVRVR